MNTTKYEDLYVSVQTAKGDTKHIDEVVAFLQKQHEPVTCRAIGIALFKDEYGRQEASVIAQVLRHLKKGGFVTVGEIKGIPIEVKYDEYGCWDANGNSETIRVHDDNGNEYRIPNPHYHGGRYGWRERTKTITPTYSTYQWKW